MKEEVLTTFVANIHYSVTKNLLYELFMQITPVKSIKYSTKYAFVDYFNKADQIKSYEKLSSVHLFGRKLDMSIVEDKTSLKIKCNSWCKKDYIKDVFGKFGSCRVKEKSSYFICTFRRSKNAQNAYEKLNGKNILGNVFHISYYKSKK